MHAPYEVPRLFVSDAPLADADVDLIIIPIAQDHAAAAAKRYDGALGDDLRAALDRQEFRAKPCEVYVAKAASGWMCTRLQRAPCTRTNTSACAPLRFRMAPGRMLSAMPSMRMAGLL